MDGRPLICVDLRHTRFIDVVGVRSLVARARAIRELGGELRLVIPEGGGRRPMAHAFELLEVGQVLELYHELLVGELGEGVSL